MFRVQQCQQVNRCNCNCHWLSCCNSASRFPIFGHRLPFFSTRLTRHVKLDGPSDWHSEIVVGRLECWWLVMATVTRRRNITQRPILIPRSHSGRWKQSVTKEKMRWLCLGIGLWHNQVTNRPSSGRMQLLCVPAAKLSMSHAVCLMLDALKGGFSKALIRVFIYSIRNFYLLFSKIINKLWKKKF